MGDLNAGPGAPGVELDGHVALVTGASRGIGRAIACELARRGAFVAVNYRSRADDAASCVAEIRAQGGEAVAWPFDVSDAAAAGEEIDRLAEEKGRLDILVNNAGIAIDGLVLRFKPADWEELLRVNLGSVFHCSRVAARIMIRRRYGRIVNLSSVVSSLGTAGQAPYAATKAGIEGFTRALARELASRQVTVNAVAPGFIDTEMTRGLSEAARETYLGQIPLRRMGTAAEVAHGVAFLAGPAADYITGQVLAINGGLYM